MRFATVIFTLLWVGGIVLAKGYWSTFFAVIMPLWAYYLVVEKFMIYMGWLT